MAKVIERRGPDDPEVEWRRTGNCVCEICGKDYNRHGMLEHTFCPDMPLYLHKLCDGRYVKL